MAHAHAGIWHPLEVSPLTDRAVTREDEEAYRERHGIDPAPRMDIRAAAYNALSPIARVLFGMIRWGVGKPGALRVILAVVGGVLAAIGFLVLLTAVVILVVLAVLGPLLVVLELLAPSDGASLWEMLLLLPFTALVWFLVWWWGGMFIRNQRRDVRRGVIVERLGAANDLEFTHRRHLREERPGSLFAVADPMGATSLLERSEHPSFEVGTWTFNRSQDPQQRTWVLESWGFAALRLPAPLPHILLDGRGQNGLLASSLPGLTAPANAQRFELEGDFNRHFTLYCPEGYETDALYLFTPDVMARLVDRAARYDVEIVDDWLFLYAKDEFATDAPDDWRALDDALRALAEKIDRWGRWRDDRRHPATARDVAAPDAAGAALADSAETVAHHESTAASRTDQTPDTGPRPAAPAPDVPPSYATPEPAAPVGRSTPRGAATQGRRLKKSRPIGLIVLAVIGCVAAAFIIGEDVVEFFTGVGELFSWIGSLF